MLSHPANNEPEEAAAATATSLMRDEASENCRRQFTVQDFLGRFDRKFFRSWFIEGPRRIIKGRFTRRAGAFMVTAAVPGIVSALFLTVPGFLFHTPEHHAFFHFAKIIEGDPASALPVLLGSITSLCSFRFPLVS